MPPRSLSSQSYRVLPMYNVRKGAVAEKIRSLGRIIRPSESSSHSTAGSDFAAPLDAKERRRQAREPYELLSESHASSPLFNSPGSESARSHRGIFDPLVRASTMLATAELDRLSFLAHSRAIDSKPSRKASTASSGTSLNGAAPPNTPGTCLGTSSAAASPLPQRAGLVTLAVPANTPASETDRPATPGSTISTKHGHRRRAAGSRLSDMCLPEDTARDVQEDSGSEPGFATVNPSAQSSPGVSSASKVADECHSQEFYHNTIPKPLSVNTSPLKGVNGVAKPACLPRLKSSAPKRPPQKKLDIERLNELLDNAISNSIVTQRLNAMAATLPHPGGRHLLESRTLHSTASSQQDGNQHDAHGPSKAMVSGTVGSRPFIASRASSPGPRRDRSGRDMSSLSAASPGIKKHMVKHIPRSVTPTGSHAVLRVPRACSPYRDGESRGLDPSCPMPSGEASGHPRRTDTEAKGKRTKVRRSTSGTVHVLEMVGSTEGSSSGTGNSDKEPPLAGDGCLHEIPKLKTLR